MSSRPVRRGRPASVILPFTVDSSAPNSRRAISLWSRDATASVTVVWPSAKSPANSTQVFTCALGTGQRPHDALHRPAGERLVSEDPRGEGLGGQNSTEHSYGGARVAGVEIGGGRAQSVQSLSYDPHIRVVNLHIDAERAHAAQRGVAIGARGIVLNPRFSVRDGGDHRVSVGDGFVAGQGDGAGNRRSGNNMLLHGNLEGLQIF